MNWRREGAGREAAMLVLITYDVNTETPAGRKRLRQVAKQCVNYGQRVQNSVFECDLDAAEYKRVQTLLVKLIDTETDSLRFYNLGDHYTRRIEHFGVKPGYDAEGTLML
jgi:CRISPR-associated protein Cas2